jgi:hypothetical protein
MFLSFTAAGRNWNEFEPNDNPNARLVQAPAVVGRFEPRAQTSFHFRSVALDPPPDGDAVGVQVPISEQLLDVAVRKGKAQITD